MHILGCLAAYLDFYPPNANGTYPYSCDDQSISMLPNVPWEIKSSHVENHFINIIKSMGSGVRFLLNFW